MELSKQDTTAIKGIAICLMLWHHLFLRTVEFGNVAHYLAQVFKVCVALFLFVSGYGLTKQYSKLEKPYFKNTVKFLLKRYTNNATERRFSKRRFFLLVICLLRPL